MAGPLIGVPGTGIYLAFLSSMKDGYAPTHGAAHALVSIVVQMIFLAIVCATIAMAVNIPVDQAAHLSVICTIAVTATEDGMAYLVARSQFRQNRPLSLTGLFPNRPTGRKSSNQSRW